MYQQLQSVIDSSSVPLTAVRSFLPKPLPARFSDKLAHVVTDENMRKQCRRIQEKYGEKIHYLENVGYALEQPHQRHAHKLDSVVYRWPDSR